MNGSINMDVSIVIVNYNTWAELDDCLNSIFEKTTGISFEIIVVDNNSRENIREKLSQEKRARVIFSKKNVGFGRANNIGIREAKGKYVFLLNSDTILKNNAVKLFYDYMEKSDADIACIGTYLKDENLNVMHSYGRFPTLKNCSYMFFFGSYARKIGLYREYMDYEKDCIERDVEYINGAALFIKKSVGDNVGWFDPRFFLYYEETDMQRNFVEHGYRNRLIVGPEILHLCGRSSSSKSYAERMKLPMMSHFIYLKKWNSFFAFYAYKVIYVLMNAINCCVCPKRQRELFLVYLKSAFAKNPNP